jgi:predicted HicB family RNase H-like nuclease
MWRRRCGVQNMKASDRYLKIVEWSGEDRCYVGTCPGLMLGGIHGNDEAKVYAELCQAVEEWIDIHKADGMPIPEPTAGKDYSGKFVVRVGKDLHRELAVNALREGVSLNSYCGKVLREARVLYGSNASARGRDRKCRQTKG